LDDMINVFKEPKKNKYGFFPYLLFGGFFVILIAAFFSAAAQNSSKKTFSGNMNETRQTDESGEEENENSPVLAVLKEIDTKNCTMTLLDTENGQDIILTYTGITDITDKYEQVIAASQLNSGEMVDVCYDKNTSVLSKVQISNRAWEYKGVVNWSLNEKENSFTILNSKYKLADNPVIFKDKQKLNLSDLDSEDELVVKGYDRQVWSILVSKGHGTIRFEDYDDFIGGTVYIGNRKILPIESDMTITIREGDYEVTMEKGNLKGTKEVTVRPFEETVLNMGEFKLPPEKKGKVTFHISPEGADLYINDQPYDYSKPIELTYGEYAVRVTLGGYMDYNGKLKVTGPSKTITIKLAENQGNNKKDNNTADDNTADNSTAGGNNQNNRKANSTGSDSNSNSGENTTKDTNSNADYTEVKGNSNIYVEEPEGASVYFDGQFKGTAPVSFPKESGTHYITLIKSGYFTKTYSVEIEDNGEDVKYNFPELKKSE
jgi:hypothetical protein